MKKETAKRSLKTAIYVRVSTEEQAQEGFSIRAQIDKLKAYAMLKEWDIFDIYADEGISGKNIVDRPAINRLIDDINAGNVENVLVFKVDRLTRSTKNLLELVELFEESGCAFNSLTESIDTDTPSGRMFLKIIGIFAEFEWENLVSRLKLGFERKAKEGYISNLCYGYTRENGQKVAAIQPEEAKIIRDIFKMYVDENMSMSKIAQSLNRRKIPTKLNAKEWSRDGIKYILANSAYAGKVRYAINDENRFFETDGHHEAIITEKTFGLAQERTKNTPTISRTKRPKENNYFCGVLACACCGGKFTTHQRDSKNTGNEGVIASYRCSNKQHFKTGVDCKSPSINHKKLEQTFTQYIENYENFVFANEAKIDENSQEKERVALEYIAEIEKKIAVMEGQKKRVMERYMADEISFEDYKNLLDVANEKLDVLDGELALARADVAGFEDEALSVAHDDIVANIRENWDELDNKERMIFLQRFVKKIVVRVEKENARSNFAVIERVEFNDTPLELGEMSGIKGVLVGRKRGGGLGRVTQYER